ncbi:MAG: hypothetical protein IPL59_06945 [Candidatus Competibacteraceae bacterium]|uniref:Uncharacterized protein n=1 Tax=Candidatus Contendobacter odensis Run_B_J11 TaxID=1400861 RepID=A0A7U7GCH7_9GAMM|nr:hypothetical protein [Candidatus Contendobacter odensis]MBK8534872.1 hypothetical protein [Candidatus Competibacteraceae bacterium]MBK8753481.1 hypothetical protein [Candidatus Competibacteraceae bacterium]CDH45901.1 conserved hypothetical protein [Candidatus Contendobacter odensis Run_B_J11]
MSETLAKRDAALAVLEEVLLAARKAAIQAQKKELEDRFQSGLKAAYYDILTVALEQADLFELDPVEFGLADFDPDSLLGAPRKAA